ncbi:MAG: 23S rRNA (guanosine(2251)-2'-O)-methyltransferase RlmB [Trueperaceae bacterium]|nr:23S rRNA (guanosine(2251)-2'-O)-methyltransferase RlmB [Trueperaceae bacterium]
MWIYGRNPVAEALEQGQVERLLLAEGVQRGRVAPLEKAARRAGIPIDRVPRIDLDAALGTTAHQGVAAELPELDHQPLDAAFARAEAADEPLLLVLLDHVQDPRNYGAIIRSAEVLGAHGVVTEARRSAPLSAVVAKTAAGAASLLPLVQVANLGNLIRDLKKRGTWIYGADHHAAEAPDRLDWRRDVALVIGAEGRGLRRVVREACDATVAIPTYGRIDTLNASVAAGVLLYAARRGRA